MKWLIWLLTLLAIVSLPVQAEVTKEISGILPLLISNNQIGLLFSEGLEKQYGVANDSEGLSRVQKVANRVLAVIQKPEAKYEFGILASDKFNASSMYGGRIRVFQGLLNETRNSDAELAAILAHEIAHNELGHNKEAVNNFKLAYVLDLTKITEKTPKLLLLAANAALAKRSRKLEKAADWQALEWLQKAGFPITGAIAIFRRIEAEHKFEEKRSDKDELEKRFAQIFATHPEPASRVEAAEDFLFEQKYGSNFKQVEGLSVALDRTNPTTGDLPVIVAHPSLWNFDLSFTNKISGVGIFNPSPLANEKKDVDFYIGVLKKGNLVAVTCDNDSHGYLGKETNRRFTFIQGDYADATALVRAIKLGQTYASSDGTEIQDMNFPIGRDYPKVNYPHFTFKLVLDDVPLIPPEIIVFRDGDNLGGFKAESYHNREVKYTIDDKDVGKGKHWYVLYIKGQLITSPITLNVTRNHRDSINPGGSSSWQKGCIHFHSFYSDGISKSIQKIWDSGQAHSVGFIFMTDHADRFTDAAKRHQTNKMYESYVGDCDRASSAMIPGIEYPLGNVKDSNHLLILNLPKYRAYEQMDENKFFLGDQAVPDKLLIEKGPFHLGDDQKDSEIHKDAVFDYGQDNATLKLRVRGTPNKDPIIWVNRQEIGRITTSDDQWHWYEFPISKEQLKNGQNLFHIQAFIPDRWQTFDDCEVADVYILKK